MTGMIEEELFARALELPKAERAELLHHECGNDEALRRRVEELLALDDSGAMLVDKPAEEAGDITTLDLAGRLAKESQSRRRLR